MKAQVTESFYKLLFDNANDGILLADLKTQKFYIANKAICKMLGYSLKEIKNLGVADIHPKKDLPYVLSQFKRQSRGNIGENILAGDMPVKRKDGSIFYADISASRIKLAGKMYLAGIFRDITYRRQMEKELENAKIAARNVLEDLESEKEALTLTKAKDEALLASIGDGVIATDQDGKIILINQAAERMLGLSGEQAMGKLLFDVYKVLDEKGDVIPDTKRPFILALKGATATASSSYFYTRKNGTSFAVAIAVTPVKVNNKITGVINVFRDITHEKEIDRAKTEFVSLVSHELRTPLTAIDGLISMIRDGEYGELSDNLKQPLKDISISSERLIHLVNDLLSLSRIQAGKLKYKLAEIDIKPIVEGVVSLLQIIAKPKGLELSISEIDSAIVLTDANKLEQILNNIIDNSLKFTDKGSVTVSTHVVDDKVEVHVNDTGIGIAKEDQAKLFGKFEQLGSSLGRPAGTGLGLHISKEMAKKMGGNVWLKESEPGKGSTFVLSIPLAKSVAAQKIEKEIEEEQKLNPDLKNS